jgi:hypothetical protein
MQLFYETWADALREVIATCGGAKQVAGKLWPEKTPDAAHRLLLDCLNETRPERLDPGCHAALTWLLRDLGYEDAKPIEPADERDQLMRDYIAATKALQALTARIESSTAR